MWEQVQTVLGECELSQRVDETVHDEVDVPENEQRGEQSFERAQERLEISWGRHCSRCYKFYHLSMISLAVNLCFCCLSLFSLAPHLRSTNGFCSCLSLHIHPYSSTYSSIYATLHIHPPTTRFHWRQKPPPAAPELVFWDAIKTVLSEGSSSTALKVAIKAALSEAEAFWCHENCIHDCFGVCTHCLLRTFLNLFSALRQDNMQNQNLIGSNRHHNNAAQHCPHQNLYTPEHFLG